MSVSSSFSSSIDIRKSSDLVPRVEVQRPVYVQQAVKQRDLVNTGEKVDKCRVKMTSSDSSERSTISKDLEKKSEGGDSNERKKDVNNNNSKHSTNSEMSGPIVDEPDAAPGNSPSSNSQKDQNWKYSQPNWNSTWVISPIVLAGLASVLCNYRNIEKVASGIAKSIGNTLSIKGAETLCWGLAKIKDLNPDIDIKKELEKFFTIRIKP